jgi:hypothetical protein
MAKGEKSDRGGTDVRDARGEASFHGRLGSGESGGGAYSNPHRLKKALNDGFMAQGGQRNMSYHGLGLLGGRKTGGNLNAPSEEDQD